MSCPDPGRLAAAVSGEDPAVIDHARDCLPCRAALVEQRQVIAALRTLARPAMRAERRAELAAEVMAASDVPQPRWRGERVMGIVAGAVVATAAAVFLLATQPRSVKAPPAPEVATHDEPAVAFRSAARLAPVRYAAPERARVIASGADYARAHEGEQDVVVLRDGELSVDATDREPVTIIAGDTRVVIAASRAKIIARRGVIVTTRVFAGTAEVTTNGRSQVIDAGTGWTREPESAPEPAASADSIAAFRAGWEHLRAHRHPQAIAAFDRATDPVVAEEAVFWGAIACERAGDADGAATRLRAFLERFPSSPRADDARAALVRVAQ